MSLIPWKPFSDLDKFFGDDDWLLPVFPRMELAKPAMDIKETDKDVIAEMEIPGFDPEKVDVSVEDGVLRVKGSMDEKKEEEKKGYWRKEIRQGSFERMVRLPAAVKEDAVEATYEKGVLKIVMPKAEVKPSSKVKIQIKEK
ncbi:MAG TPA: Hsp20/alpha crystallin family protein [Candidatus Pacearchaeota archaeon]|mgnify:FL=1|nr:Hsp20/alpha crystallin family protein [Candidatus Pacearchaeota archaeon]HQI26298.1 Hsp20/alpha crystallin family protein [Candidatus Paceibacterota bacterium]